MSPRSLTFRVSMPLLAGLLFAPALAPAAQSLPPEPLDEAACVQIAAGGSPKVQEAQARVDEYLARLAGVRANYYPKLWATTYLAPMFTVRGDALRGVERDFSPGAWGPYLHLDALLVQPLYQFGRIRAGERAASERAEVERGRLEEVRQAVARETRTMYQTRLYALSMQPVLRRAERQVAEAIEKGTEAYEAGTGEVSQADLMRLTYARLEVASYLLQAKDGARLATAALSQIMGFPPNAALRFAEDRQRRLPPGPEPALPELLKEALRARPELAQLAHGLAAAEAWEEAEAKALWPLLFAGANLKADWSPVREDTDNPYHMDSYNDLSGGVALGFRFELDPWAVQARAAEARATRKGLLALKRYADTGIPLQVQAAHTELTQWRERATLAGKAIQATRRWVAFSGAAYMSGTGEARDLLEGLAAYVKATQDRNQALLQYHSARAALDQAVGRISGP